MSQRLAVCAVLLAAALGAAADPMLAAASCPTSQGSAATLLFPYFEVDLDGGRTTLLAIGGDRGFQESTLARVTLWTDWGVPTLAFDLFLRSGDLQTINLRDLFATGDAPVTRPPAGAYPDCAGRLGGHLVTPATLQLQHTGRSIFGFCFASPRRDPMLATGYVTVDVVKRCSLPTGNPSTPNPSTSLYFNLVASTDNELWGDFMLVDGDQSYASGQSAVAIKADTGLFRPGDYTFYGKFVRWTARDARRPLSGQWSARYAQEVSFVPFEGTELIVWRDNRYARNVPVPCGTNPRWMPMGERGLSANAADGRYESLGTRTEIFDLVTQRVDVGSVLRPPFLFGWLGLDLFHKSGATAQAWVGWTASSPGGFSVLRMATPRNPNPCSMRH
jgi:hypothetical protein